MKVRFIGSIKSKGWNNVTEKKIVSVYVSYQGEVSMPALPRKGEEFWITSSHEVMLEDLRVEQVAWLNSEDKKGVMMPEIELNTWDAGASFTDEDVDWTSEQEVARIKSVLFKKNQWHGITVVPHSP